MRYFFVAAAFLTLLGCQNEPKPEVRRRTAEHRVNPEADGRPVIAAFGDSISAGFGVDPRLSYPEDLQRMLDRSGYAYRVVNAGISGDTTSGGVARLGSIVAYKPAVVILELGGNDGLRGLPIEITRSNLEQMLTTLKASGATVVLAGMTLPPNYGSDYIRAFERIYKDLAGKYDAPLIPFLLEGVGAQPGMMQDDGIHPTAAGHRRVAANVYRVLEGVLKK